MGVAKRNETSVHSGPEAVIPITDWHLAWAAIALTGFGLVALTPLDFLGALLTYIGSGGLAVLDAPAIKRAISGEA